MKKHPTEDQEQKALVEWLTINHTPFYHVPNGGFRNQREAANLKRLGVRPGVPDICIPVPNNLYHGLYIELKRIGGSVVSDNQKMWIDLLNENGYLAKVCIGFDCAKNVIVEYMRDISG